MKTLFARFRISARMDRDEQPHARAAAPPTAPPALRQFEAAMRELDARLRASRPVPRLPPGLHASVMRAVRTAAAEPRSEHFRPILRVAFASACVFALAAAVWWFAGGPAQNGREPGAPPSLAVATVTLEQGSRWATLAPEAAVTPLTREWEMVQRDVRGAVEFLLTSLP